ncbi:hypothetical protein AC578_3310 [Pseudocercospora eumusae]|uniref:Uncharacterized protein n=1 Tax=Pseudocercospora eumusae TaxID=321146 RepID=A0A139HCE7_9PEZI|nr:hypothetical protein AC578_3310 [Pseudocercospora eumusae]
MARCQSIAGHGPLGLSYHDPRNWFSKTWKSVGVRGLAQREPEHAIDHNTEVILSWSCFWLVIAMTGETA